MSIGIRTTIAALAVVGAVVALAPRAEALLQAAASIDGGATLTACDNNLCGAPSFLDLDPTIGVLATGPATAGDIRVSFAVQTAAKSSGPGGLNTLSSGGTVVENTGLVSHLIRLTISEIDFVGPAVDVTATGSGTWVDPSLPALYGDTAITMEWFNDPANGQGAAFAGDTPGNLVHLATDAPVDGISNQSFAFDVSGPLAVPDGGRFSMTLDNELTLAPGIRLESRGQAEAKPTAVAAPATLLLVGLGLLLRAGRRARRDA